MEENELALLQEGRAAELIPIFKERIARNPSDKETRMDLASAYEQAGQVKEAITVYEELLHSDPNDIGVLTNIGYDYHCRGEIDPAQECLTKAIEVGKTRDVDSLILSLAHTNLGSVYATKLDFDRAIHHYKTAIALNSDNHLAHQALDELKEAEPEHGILRMRILPDGRQVPDVWYYRE